MSSAGGRRSCRVSVLQKRKIERVRKVNRHKNFRKLDEYIQIMQKAR